MENLNGWGTRRVWPIVFAFVAALPPGVFGQNLQEPGATNGVVVTDTAGRTIADRGANHRIWAKVTPSATNELGQISYRTNAYTELSAGLYHKVGTNWVESSENIELTQEGGAATNGQRKAFFAANINTIGAIRTVTPDNTELRGHVIGLSYYDSTTVSNVLFGVLQDSIGSIVASNQVIYSNAFTGIKVDLRYTCRLGGFEQDVVLRERLPSPAGWGLNPATTTLQLWTEFVDAPVPNVTELPDGKGQSISFGGTKFGPGRAFFVGDEKRAVAVRKRWVVNPQTGRTCLLEEIELSAVAERLQTLPAYSGGNTNGGGGGGSGGGQAWLYPKFPAELPPPPRLAQNRSQPLKLALGGAVRAPALVLDYVEVDVWATNYTFSANTTYLIPRGGYLLGTTTIEGGAVLKFGDDSYYSWGLELMGPLVCPSDVAHPAFLTSPEDNSVGENISSGHYDGPFTASYVNYLYLDSAYIDSLKNLRFAYAYSAVFLAVCSEMYINNCEFLNCEYGIQTIVPQHVHLFNDLFGGVGTALLFSFDVYPDIYLTAQQVTADCGTFWAYYGNQPGFYIANSIIVGGFTTPYTLYTSCNAINPGGTLFTSLGADNYYLADNTYRDAGNDTADLFGLYHYTTATSQAQEAGSTVDLGYHYLARDANGNPADTDGDGIPDYREDANGEGTHDVLESDWQDASDIGLRVFITKPKNNSIIP